jgi:hypothetical protein
MYERFSFVGYVKKVRAGDNHVVAEVPGKVALVIEDEFAGECLGYFSRERRPLVGARIGVRGEYVVVDVPLESIPPEDLERIGRGKPVQHQLDVADWTKVSRDYDPMFD